MTKAPSLLHALATLVLFVTACARTAPGKPVVVITAPPSPSQFNEGEEVEIEIIADDVRAVNRIEFFIDGSRIKTESAPSGQDHPMLIVIFLWKATPGRHTFVARTFNSIEQFADSAPVVVEVAPAVAQAAPTNTPGVPPLPTDPPSGFDPRATAVPPPTSVAMPTATIPAPANAACSGTPTLSTFTVTTEQITEGASTRIQWGLVTNSGSVQIEPGIGVVETPGYRDVSPRATTTYTLTARCGANVKTAQITIAVNPGGPVASSFAGSWVHNFGVMAIIQAGAYVLPASEYTNAHTGKKGSVSGTVTSNTLNGTWTDEGGSGVLQLYLGSDGNSFDGARMSGQQQLRWCGAWPGSPFPTGCSFAGLWTISLPVNPACAAMILTRVDNTITGNLCGAPLTGTLRYEGPETILSGTANVGGRNGPFTLYTLGGFNATQFQGNWGNNPLNEWCGWRGNAPKPSPCGK